MLATQPRGAAGFKRRADAPEGTRTAFDGLGGILMGVKSAVPTGDRFKRDQSPSRFGPLLAEARFAL
jgi:hypothetical protein